MSDKAISFDEWWKTESGWGSKMLSEGQLAKAAWRAGRHNLFKSCVPKTEVFTREDALKLAVDEILACGRLKILCEEGNNLRDGNFYQAESTNEVLAKLKVSE